VPKILDVIQNPEEPSLVRERSLWALRVYGFKFRELRIEPALIKVIKETTSPDKRMLRFDAAYSLGLFQGPKVDPAALDVLLEFLKDPTIKIYTGSVGTKEQGTGDGRSMAIGALKSIGPKTLAKQKDIIAELEHLAADAGDPLLKTGAKELLIE